MIGRRSSGVHLRIQTFRPGGCPVEPSWLVFRVESVVVSVVWGVSQLLYALTFMGGVEMGDGSDGSGDSGLYCSLLSCACVTTAIVLRIIMLSVTER